MFHQLRVLFCSRLIYIEMEGARVRWLRWTLRWLIRLLSGSGGKEEASRRTTHSDPSFPVETPSTTLSGRKVSLSIQSRRCGSHPPNHPAYPPNRTTFVPRSLETLVKISPKKKKEKGKKEKNDQIYIYIYIITDEKILLYILEMLLTVEFLFTEMNERVNRFEMERFRRRITNCGRRRG